MASNVLYPASFNFLAIVGPTPGSVAKSISLVLLSFLFSLELLFLFVFVSFATSFSSSEITNASY